MIRWKIYKIRPTSYSSFIDYDKSLNISFKAISGPFSRTDHKSLHNEGEVKTFIDKRLDIINQYEELVKKYSDFVARELLFD